VVSVGSNPCISSEWAKHLLLAFRLQLNNNENNSLLIDFERLLTEREGVAKITRWWTRRGILNQFKLAKDLIK
jgi:hypothetical protein